MVEDRIVIKVYEKYLTKLNQQLVDEFFKTHSDMDLSSQAVVEIFLTWVLMKGYSLGVHK